MTFDPSKFEEPDTGQDRLSQFAEPEETFPAANQPVSQAAEQAPQQEVGPVTAFASGVNRAIGPFPRGILQLVNKVVGSPAVKRSLIAQDLDERKAFEQAKRSSPIAANVGNIGASILGASLVPGGVTGGLLRRTLASGAAGAALGASSFKGEGESRVQDAAIGGALGAAGPIIGKAVGSAARAGIAGVKGSRLGNLVRGNVPEKLARNIDPDIPLTPAERVPSSQLLRSAQARTVLNSSQAQKVEAAINSRDELARSKFREVLRQVVPEGEENARAAMEKIYGAVDDIEVPESAKTKIFDNPILLKAFSQVESNPAFAAAEKATGSVGRLRLIKDVLDDDIGRLMRTGESKQARNLIKAKEVLVNELDNVAPEFKVGRAISQRLKIKENFNSELEKIKVEGNDVTPENIFKKLFSDKNKRDVFLSEIEQAGVDPKAANKLINTLGLITKAKTRNILTKEPGLKGAISRFGSVTKGAALNVLDSLQADSGEALIEVLTNPKWSKDLGKLQRAQSTEAAIQRLGTLLGKASVVKEEQ